MTYDFFMGQLRLIAIGIIAYLAGSGRLTATDASALTAVMVPVGLLAGPYIWSLYRNIGMKLVPHDSIAIEGGTPLAVDRVNKDGTLPVGATITTLADTAKVVGALLIGFILFAPISARAQSKPPGACSLQTFVGLFKNGGIDPVTFLTNLSAGLKNCGASDTSAALKDAVDNADMEAQACLKPLNDIALAAQADTGQGGIIYKVQKFRDARRSGIVTACTNYFNSTFGPFR